jgi:hypothetical protein
MKQGRAFAVSSSGSDFAQNNQSRLTSAAASVYKSWVHVQGRTFLIEQVPVNYLAADLSTLPDATNSISANPTASSYVKMASNNRQLPPAPEMVADTSQIQIASTDFNQQPGVVLDYNAIDSDQGDCTFTNGTTYLISGAVNISGTATFEGGTVLKFPEGGSGGLNCNSNVVCDTAAEQPAVFTSVNDDSVGEIVSGSSGTPATGQAGYVSSLGYYYSADILFEHCRFSYAALGVDIQEGGVFDDVQFVQCNIAIIETSCYPGGLRLNNSLVTGCDLMADADVWCSNDTFDRCNGINDWDWAFEF